jgi:hypothetical protein
MNEQQVFEKRFKDVASNIGIDPKNIEFNPETDGYGIYLHYDNANHTKRKKIGFHAERTKYGYGYCFQLHNSHPLGELRIPLSDKGKFNKLVIDNMIRTAILDTPRK